MARRHAKYTDLGRKIAALARNQAELAGVLGLTQQSISGKLTGKIAVTIKDLDKLSQQYDVPAVYFVSSCAVTPDLARAWEKIVEGPPELHAILEIASTFPRLFLIQLLRTVEAMRVTVSYYRELWRRDQECGAEGPCVPRRNPCH